MAVATHELGQQLRGESKSSAPTSSSPSSSSTGRIASLMKSSCGTLPPSDTSVTRVRPRASASPSVR
jgi:hypothetical protein